MQQYGITFGFREPYQVLLDAQIIQDADRFKMDLISGLERILHGKVKPMITQCSMRHLYNAKPPVPNIIEIARGYERRRCNHHTLDQPLSSLDCFSDIVDPKGSKTNKHHYVVASQAREVRAFMRTILGVPLLYISRSVMIMEPMSSSSLHTREKEEQGKFRIGLKGHHGSLALNPLKRKRPDHEQGTISKGTEPTLQKPQTGPHTSDANSPGLKPRKKKLKWTPGPKGPNPLSVVKSKKKSPMIRPPGGQLNTQTVSLALSYNTTESSNPRFGISSGGREREKNPRKLVGKD
ncbi:MAG: hypothetical protein M1829_000632 [Trizodia sp. TS-e1964]|nr:MAG: hypothetical protein M1829_000632 [Trizodia sp. TS-e1964]